MRHLRFRRALLHRIDDPGFIAIYASVAPHWQGGRMSTTFALGLDIGEKTVWRLSISEQAGRRQRAQKDASRARP
jgi:hypothetical protein